MTEISFETTGL